jgi:hypothetical protein
MLYTHLYIRKNISQQTRRRLNMCSGAIIIKLFILNPVRVHEDGVRLGATTILNGSTSPEQASHTWKICLLPRSGSSQE